MDHSSPREPSPSTKTCRPMRRVRVRDIPRGVSPAAARCAHLWAIAHAVKPEQSQPPWFEYCARGPPLSFAQCPHRAVEANMVMAVQIFDDYAGAHVPTPAMRTLPRMAERNLRPTTFALIACAAMASAGAHDPLGTNSSNEPRSCESSGAVTTEGVLSVIRLCSGPCRKPLSQRCEGNFGTMACSRPAMANHRAQAGRPGDRRSRKRAHSCTAHPAMCNGRPRRCG